MFRALRILLDDLVIIVCVVMLEFKGEDILYHASRLRGIVSVDVLCVEKSDVQRE